MQSWVRLKAKWGSDRSTASKVIKQSCRLSYPEKIYTINLDTAHCAEDPMVMILTY
jgi:hypothetical protein